MGISEAPGKVGPGPPGTGRPPGERCRGLARITRIREGEDLRPWFALLEDCLGRDGIEHQRLAPVTVTLLKRHPALQPLPPLATLALTRMVLPDPVLERFFTALRRQALEALVPPDPGSAPGSRPPGAGPAPTVESVAALARQCFLTGYVYPLPESEERRVEALAAALARNPLGTDAEDPLRVALLACYVPMFRWKDADAIAAWAETLGNRNLPDLIRQQLLEPREEEELRRTIPLRGEVADRTSKEVRAHYEENPYPRWISVEMEDPGTVPPVVREILPGLRPAGRGGTKGPRILVAGCGTGQSLLRLHHRFPGARVHGVDLSLASLGFALRKIREYGATGITVEQADILSLAGWLERFDLVESVGVLQHMEDPVGGWRILRGLLVPGGLMKIGLYSESARKPITEAKRYLAERGYGPSPEDVRRARMDLASEFGDRADAWFLSHKDFFTMQECRDLLFHTHEHAFTLPRIRELLPSLGLEFLGFEITDPAVRDDFLTHHPEAGAERDLNAWTEFESRNPATFRDLYQLWLRAV